MLKNYLAEKKRRVATKAVDGLIALADLTLGHKVLVSRSNLAKAWRDEVDRHIPDKVTDVSGSIYDSAFNDFCKALGLKEGK